MGKQKNILQGLCTSGQTFPYFKMSKYFVIFLVFISLSSIPSGCYGNDDPYVFMPEYRCLDHPYMPNNPRGRFYTSKRDIRDLMSDFHSEETLRDKPDCGVIDPAWCKGQGQNYPIPCNCHAYFTCNVLDQTATLKPCPHWCEPRSLVFDSNTQVCVKYDQAPPGICFDTPSTIDPTEPTTEPAPTTTPEPTTTAEPTTTPEPTSPTEPPTTTPNAAEDCDFDGQKLPFPGNCHDYYVCFEDGNGSGNFHVQVFNCGETWVYDPNTGSCTWPEEAADDLCKY